MSEYPESFADYPRTLGDARAERAADGRLISPRETLLELLKAIDRGETDPTQIFICYKKPCGGVGYWSGGGGGATELLGVIERAKLDWFLDV
jgi:hypothetical protein